MSVVAHQLIDYIDQSHQLEPVDPAKPFHLPALLRMWHKALGWNGLVIRCGDTALPGFEKSTPLGKLFFSMPFGCYGGFAGAKTANEIKTICAWLSSRRYLQENITQFGEVDAAAVPSRYQRMQLTTHVIDLSKPRPEFSENTRRNIEKAQSEKLTYRRLREIDVSTVLNLLTEHQRRTKENRRLPISCYEYLFHASTYARSGIMVNCAEKHAVIQGVHIYFVADKDAFYFDGFSSQEGLNHGANFYLFDSAIKSFAEKGIQRFNLGATPINDFGLKRFKEGWGAAETGYCEYSRRSMLKFAIDSVKRRR